MGNISSYSKPLTLGHAALAPDREGRPGLLDVQVVVEEKIDGSQFSFRKNEDGTIDFRSRGAVVYPEARCMFSLGVEAILSIADDLRVGWTYRGEYLSKPKHNTLAYHRVPKHHVVIFDVETEPSKFLTPAQRDWEATRLGLDFVPVYFKGRITGLNDIIPFLECESILGGPIEGVVIKPLNHALWGRDGKTIMGKFVSEGFKERNGANHKAANPGRKDVVELIKTEYRTEARWAKAVQHLSEAGKLQHAPQDIGLLIKEVPQDILADSENEIKDRLFKYFWPQISRGVTAGLPEWYKNQLAEAAFQEPA